jgi:hypothetical protein
MRLITPRWSEKVAAKGALAPAQKVVNFRKAKDEASD